MTEKVEKTEFEVYADRIGKRVQRNLQDLERQTESGLVGILLRADSEDIHLEDDLYTTHHSIPARSTFEIIGVPQGLYLDGEDVKLDVQVVATHSYFHATDCNIERSEWTFYRNPGKPLPEGLPSYERPTMAHCIHTIRYRDEDGPVLAFNIPDSAILNSKDRRLPRFDMKGISTSISSGYKIPKRGFEQKPYKALEMILEKPSTVDAGK